MPVSYKSLLEGQWHLLCIRQNQFLPGGRLFPAPICLDKMLSLGNFNEKIFPLDGEHLDINCE